ncbi:CBM35 domain-containing protein [Paenibacillus sp. LHD-117]|uniref:CBM35 domain-containing protein n=1 Tax=Paenibacillus sp. LHD-117 TaxID=3071412 RepID=UPI0027E1186E|nr:CBM35 domain-containing protein [Paenibacillus sp. LHD-117]MDQ6419666.1 CBM35 domain-containing protein [Paenibacillus sp. LHD-117]
MRVIHGLRSGKSKNALLILAAAILILASFFSPVQPIRDVEHVSATTAEAEAAAAETATYSFEAEALVNALAGKAEIKNCQEATGCSGGKLVGGLWGGSSLTFNEVVVEEAGVYTMTVHYISGDPRPFALSVNGGGSDQYSPPATANWETLGAYELQLELQAGANVIAFSDGGGYSPDIDRIELRLTGPDEPGNPPAGTVYEAEASANVLTGNAAVSGCQAATGCSGGQKVGNLWGGSMLQFRDVTARKVGVYQLKISYVSGDPRPISISVNGGTPENYAFPKTDNWDTLGVFAVEVELNQGANTITFDDDGGWSPDIDKIEVVASGDSGEDPGPVDDIGLIGEAVRSEKFGSIRVTEHEKGATFATRSYGITFNTESGLSAIAWNDGKTVIKGAYASAQLDDGTLLDSRKYGEHRFSLHDVVKIKDNHGKGIRVTVENREEGLPTMKQVYHLYDDQPYVLVSQQLVSDSAIRSNDMAPLAVHASGGVDIGSYGDKRVLITPFDNDMWSRYQARTINTSLNNNNYISSEMTAVYDNDSRAGLVIGSVTHDVWKTGIYWSGSNDRLNKLKVFGGFTSQTSTHDTIAHGYVEGTTLTSPQIMIGYYDDYRDGLEGYGEANAAVAPPLEFGRGVPSGVPVGWNSWGAYESSLSYDKVVAVSDFVKANLQKTFNNKGNVYINMDSYWDNLTDQQLRDAVKKIRKNGQKAGIYYGPFVYWGDNMAQPVEGTDGKYTYGDIILRDSSGNPLPKVDGAYAIDPTHPGSKQRVEYVFKKFLDYGFEYIKIDFLSHGSFEGVHYDPQATTGIQAYNQGMAHINQTLKGRMFISASIAPLFPSQYAHARRISCDIDGSLGRTEYQLNNLTYGFWQNGTIYRYTDPDYMTLIKGGSYNAAQTRVNAAAISGTVFMSSDDVFNPEAQQLMKSLLTNKNVNEVALLGEAFRPVEGNTGTSAADVFVLQDKKDVYLAVFNYTNEPAAKQVDLGRAFGVKAGIKAELTDVWTGAKSEASGTLDVTLEAGQSKLYKVKLKK